MYQAAGPVMLLSMIIFIQILILDMSKYYNVMIDIFSNEKKIRYFDIIMLILLLPVTVFLYLEVKFLNNDMIVDTVINTKFYKWLNTEIDQKNKG